MIEEKVEYSEEELYHELFSELWGYRASAFFILLNAAGSAKEAFFLEEKLLETLPVSPGVRQEFAAFRKELRKRFPGISELEEWKRKELGELGDNGIRYLSRISPGFPAALSRIPDPPIGIYYKGRISDLELPAISMIGARSCSGYGRRMAEEFAEAFVRAGLCVVSGMARGIDGISQKSALKAGGKSIGVLGCGVDICYPAENRDVYEALPLSGGILSEYAPKTAPRGLLFPRRNRLISGLGKVLLVVEARKKSGTAITVDMALEQGREVYVIPGRATDALSEGCNELLCQGALPAFSPEQMLKELGYERRQRGGTGTLPEFEDSLQREIYEALEENPVTIEELACALEEQGRDPDFLSLNRKLSYMVMTGWVTQPAPGFYARA